MSGEENKYPRPQKKKKRGADERIEVVVRYVEHPGYEKTLREAPAGYLAQK